MNNKFISFFLILLLIVVDSTSYGSSSEKRSPYQTPQSFWNLYYDFTGNDPSNKDKISISKLLVQSEENKLSKDKDDKSVLILFINSTLYIYDGNRNLLLKKVMRTAPDSGFTELTAISHIGPAMAYLAKIKENGDDGWKAQMQNLLKDVKAVKATNQVQTNNWLSQIDAPPWKKHTAQIHNMVDYACDMTVDYMTSVLNNKIQLSMDSVQNSFFNGNKNYPIPYNNVMVGTFMLTALQSMSEVYSEVSPLKVDWSKAKVVIRFLAGKNVTSGLTNGSNWLVPYTIALSNNTLPLDRIYIAPYAEVKSGLGQKILPQSDYDYYLSVWDSVNNRTHIALKVFTTIPTIYLPGRPAIPGDFGYSSGGAIDDFIIRLKFSLANASEMLSNTVGFWMAGELASKNWDYNSITIPGLTSGFPKGITKYPSSDAKSVHD